MHAEDATVHQRAQIQVVEYIHELLPNADSAEFTQTLIIEAVHLRDLTALVIAAEKRDTRRIAHLQRQQQQKCLYTEIAAIDVITHE